MHFVFLNFRIYHYTLNWNQELFTEQSFRLLFLCTCNTCMAALAFSLASICLQTISNSTCTKRIMASQLSPSPKFTLYTWHLLSLYRYRCCYEYAEWTSHPLVTEHVFSHPFVTEHVLCEQLEAIQYQKLKLQHSSSSVL